MRSAISCFDFAICLLAFMPIAHAQEIASTPKISTSTNLVVVPVSVTDNEGQHVSGLARDDFQLKQDGVVVPIATFEEHARKTSSQPVSDTASASREPEQLVFTNQSASTRPETTVLIFAIDLVNTPSFDLMIARKAILKFLATQLKDDQTVAIVTIDPGRVRLLHTFTTSTSVLSAALQRAIGLVAVPEVPESTTPVAVGPETEELRQFLAAGRESEKIIRAERLDRRQKSTLEALSQIGSWLAGIQGRKVLIWVTGDVPFVFLNSLDVEEYRTNLEKLADANIAIYPVDVRGVLGPGLSGEIWGSTAPGSDLYRAHQANIQNGVGGGSLQLGVVSLDSNHHAMNDVARFTGGRAFYNRNDIQGLFEKAEAESADYYMLGYYLDRRHRGPGWHKLDVKVNRPHVNLRSRTGFIVPKAPADPEAVRKADENLALLSPFEYTALPLSVTWKYITPVPNSQKLKVQFDVFVSPTAGLPNDGNAMNLDFIAVATAINGDIAGRAGQNVHRMLPPDAVQQVASHGLTYTSELELTPGEYAVRLVVRDNLTGRIGSVVAALKVKSVLP